VKFISIQILRAYAAMLVVIFHSQAIVPQYSHSISKSAELMGSFGTYGVDLFFIISGFVITYTVQKSHPSAIEFLVKRLIRIVPLYWSLTLFYVLLSMIFPAAFNDVSQLTLSHLGISLGFISFINNPFPILGVGWTLEYEMLFYLIASGILLFTSSLFVPVGILFIGCLLLGNIDFLPINVQTFFKNQIIFEFLLGMAIAKWFFDKKFPIKHLVLLIVSLGVILVASDGYRFFYAGIPSAIVVMLALRYESKLKLLPGMQMFKSIGDASYCLYLIQVFAIPFLAKVLFKVLPTLNADFFVLIALIITVLSSIILHKFFERPVLKVLTSFSTSTGGFAPDHKIV
jgi:exopolysaccharide production protein ExoZ